MTTPDTEPVSPINGATAKHKPTRFQRERTRLVLVMAASIAAAVFWASLQLSWKFAGNSLPLAWMVNNVFVVLTTLYWCLRSKADIDGAYSKHDAVKTGILLILLNFLGTIGTAAVISYLL